MTRLQPRDLLDRTIIDLARAGYSLQKISQQTGRSTSVLSWRIRRMGTTIAALRNIRCDYCGALMDRGQRGGNTHACRKPRCQQLRHRDANRTYYRYGRVRAA